MCCHVLFGSFFYSWVLVSCSPTWSELIVYLKTFLGVGVRGLGHTHTCSFGAEDRTQGFLLFRQILYLLSEPQPQLLGDIIILTGLDLTKLSAEASIS